MKKYWIRSVLLLACVPLILAASDGAAAGDGSEGGQRADSDVPGADVHDGPEVPPIDAEPDPAPTMDGYWTGASVSAGDPEMTVAYAASVRSEGDAVYTVLEISEAEKTGYRSLVFDKTENGYESMMSFGEGKTALCTLSLSSEELEITYPSFEEGNDIEMRTLAFSARADLPAAQMPAGIFYFEDGEDIWELDFSDGRLLIGGEDQNADLVCVGAYVTVNYRVQNVVFSHPIASFDGTLCLLSESGAAPLLTERPVREFVLAFSLGACEGVAYAGLGQTPSPLTADEGNGYTVQLPAAPVWEGYEFLHWEIGGEEYAPSARVTLRENTTATAVWGRIPAPPAEQFEVTFDLGAHAAAGETVAPRSAAEGEEIVLPEPAADDGYEFEGWFDGERLYAAGERYPVRGPAELTARWSAIEYTIRFEGNKPAASHGEIVGLTAPTTASYERPLFTLPAITLAGYTLEGWRYDGYLMQPSMVYVNTIDPPVAGKEIVFVAQWKAIEYTVHFDGNLPAQSKGTIEGLPSDTAVSLEQPDVSLPSLALTGYTHAGWLFGGRPVSSFVLTEAELPADGTTLTFTAHWSPIEYTLRFDTARPSEATGTVAGETGDLLVTLDDPVRTLPRIALEGYLFRGWTLRGAGAADEFTLTEELISGLGEGRVFLFTAVWEKVPENRYAITFSGGAEDGSVTGLPAPESVPKGDYTLPGQEPVRLGYTFEGWLAESAVYRKGEHFSVTDHAVEFVAQWRAIAYTLAFEEGADAQQMPETGTVSLEADTFTAEPEPVRTGYLFLGWTWTGNAEPAHTFRLTKELIRSLEGGTTILLTANWQAVEYTVRLDGGTHAEAALPEARTMTLDAPEWTPAPPELRGYEFLGWTWAGNATPKATFTLTADVIQRAEGNIVLTAQWKAVEYTVIFAAARPEHAVGELSGSAPPVTVSLDEPAFRLPALTLAGYAFGGWKWGEGVAFSEDVATFRAEWIPEEGTQITLTAVWTAIEYTLRFSGGVHGDAALPQPLEVTLEAPEITPPPAELIGYEFLGWTWTEDGAPSMTFTLTEAAIAAAEGESLTLVARFSAIVYTLHFVQGTPGGAEDLPESMEVSLEAPEAEPAAPTLAGYAFLGWTWEGNTVPEGRFVLTAETISALGGGTVFTLTANWDKLPVAYTLKFYKSNGYTEEVGSKVVYVSDGAAFRAEDLEMAATMPNMAFAGWFYADERGERAVDTSFVPSDYGVTEFRFYAKWTFEVKIGTPNNALDDFGAPVYFENIYVGERITFKGRMTSLAAGSEQTVSLYLYPENIWGSFRMDGMVTGTEAYNEPFYDDGPILLFGLYWTITKNIGLDAATFLDTVKDCAITITADWTDPTAIVLRFEAQANGAVQRMEYRVTAMDGYSLGESYTLGIGGQRSYTVLTERSEEYV